MINKIDRAAGSMMENGLHTLTAFMTKIQAQRLSSDQSDPDHSEIHALTIDDLRGSLILAFIAIIFLLELARAMNRS